jgi:two-component system, sensor histidine kinase and response regulator
LKVCKLSGSTELDWNAAFQAFGDAVWVLDADGVVRQCNEAMSRLLDLPVDQILGQQCYRVMHQMTGFPPDCAFKRSRESCQREHRQLALGDRLFLDCSDPIFDAEGLVRGAVHSLQDITERKRAEDALIEARVEAEAASRAKSEFVTNVSHELRTPLHAILGMIELALRDGLAPAVRGYLQSANESAEVLLDLLNQILDFSKVEAGKLVLEEVHFNLGTVLDQLIGPLGVKAQQKGLELCLDVPRHVPTHLIGDPLRLREVVANLVDNSIKFTQHGEVVVRVEVHSTAVDTAWLGFSVVDTGIGLSDEEHQQIFDPFHQADRSLARRQGGTGLGLPIASQLVRLMGGQLQVESEPGRGSTFSFIVPLRLASEVSDPAPLEIAFLARLHDVPVLVVESHATSRRLLCEILGGWGMKPVAADDARTALTQAELALAADQPFPLVLVDANVPELHEGDLIRQLRKHQPKRAATIIVAWPSHHQTLAKRRRLASKALFLSKPVISRELLLAIARGLGLIPEVASAPPVPASLGKAARSLRILVAEDTAVGRLFATEVLQERGHAVQTAEDGRQAFELARDRDFDVILLDIQMPVMDGFRTTSAIRGLPDPVKSQLPIVAVSAHAIRGYEQHCLAAGMNGYLSKPLRGQTLIELVERFA